MRSRRDLRKVRLRMWDVKYIALWALGRRNNRCQALTMRSRRLAQLRCRSGSRRHSRPARRSLLRNETLGISKCFATLELVILAS
jgi:hypothetical protein